MSAKQPFGAVLVIGGCGFLGHHIVSQLLEEDPTAQVSVLDLHTDRNRLPSVDYYDGDITSKVDVHFVLQRVRPQSIIHTASPTAVFLNASLYDKVNIGGTRCLLECAQHVGSVKAFVYTSSASVVHDNFHDLSNADENFPLVYVPEQREYYTHTKAVAECLVLAANGQHGMLTTAIRPAGMFGENDLVLTKRMIGIAQEGKLRIQIGDGTNKFDFTYVGNAASAHLLALEALLRSVKSSTPIPPNERVEGEAFFVTNGEPMPFWDFARAIGAAAGHPVKKEDVWVIPKRLGYAIGAIAEWVVWATTFGTKNSTFTRSTIRFACMTRTFCIDKARNGLNYRVNVSLQEGIKRAVDSYQGDVKKAQ
ncbi:hypothetical protein MMC34_001153 [Xylographa carneopallida]|nr:hypothetical protein [Xylographa carneopallida]